MNSCCCCLAWWNEDLAYIHNTQFRVYQYGIINIIRNQSFNLPDNNHSLHAFIVLLWGKYCIRMNSISCSMQVSCAHITFLIPTIWIIHWPNYSHDSLTHMWSISDDIQRKNGYESQITHCEHTSIRMASANKQMVIGPKESWLFAGRTLLCSGKKKDCTGNYTL